MTPGPKKKNFSRRGGDKGADNLQDTKKNLKPSIVPQTASKNDSSTANFNSASINSDYNQDKKFTKRTVANNWTKYDEPVVDRHADMMRGKDFEVLMSYSGGLQSHLQLQEEKEWDEVISNEKSIALDLQDLVRSVKSIPFHKRMALPVDIFDDDQISRFNSNAESWKTSFKSSQDLSISREKELELEPVDHGSNIIESYELDEVDVVLPNPCVLEEKTENIIESLASCLSLRSLLPKIEKAEDPDKKNESTTDDLDFLLSLSTSSSKKILQENSNDQKQTNVDDWLNSILDD